MLVNMCVAWVQNYFNPAFLCGHLYPRFCEHKPGDAAPFTKYFPLLKRKSIISHLTMVRFCLHAWRFDCFSIIS